MLQRSGINSFSKRFIYARAVKRLKRGVMMKGKKGDLALSVNAIVIVVISFVVLGLALTLTRSIFKFAGEKAESVIPLTELEAQPTAENPISIPDTISIPKGGSLSQSVGYYNTRPDTAEQARFSIYDCLYTDANGQEKSIREDDDSTILPKVISPAQDIPASQKGAYKVIINERGLAGGGTYICTLTVHKDRQEPTDENSLKDKSVVYETKQIFLKVVA